MPANPRHRARCDRHEARTVIVALMSCCLVRLSFGGLGPLGETVSLPACTQRSVLRGAALASRVDPLILSGYERGRSNALSFAELNGTSIPDPEPVSCSCDPDNWAHGRHTPGTSAKNILSAGISFSPRAAIFPLLDWFARCVAHDCCNPKHSVAFGHDSSFFAVNRQQWRACVRRMPRCRLACTLPPSSLGPRLASGAFAVAEDEGRDRFIGDRRPLDSRENGIGHSHFTVHGYVA